MSNYYCHTLQLGIIKNPVQDTQLGELGLEPRSV